MAAVGSAHRIQPALSILLRLALSVVFAYAGVAKLQDVVAFAADVESYRLFPDALIVPLTFFVPALEVTSALGLWVPRYRLAASGMLTLLLAAFIALLSLSWARGLDITCGCFGKVESNHTDYPYLLVRDLALFALAVIVFVLERRRVRPSMPL